MAEACVMTNPHEPARQRAGPAYVEPRHCSVLIKGRADESAIDLGERQEIHPACPCGIERIDRIPWEGRHLLMKPLEIEVPARSPKGRPRRESARARRLGSRARSTVNLADFAVRQHVRACRSDGFRAAPDDGEH